MQQWIPKTYAMRKGNHHVFLSSLAARKLRARFLTQLYQSPLTYPYPLLYVYNI